MTVAKGYSDWIETKYSLCRLGTASENPRIDDLDKHYLLVYQDVASTTLTESGLQKNQPKDIDNWITQF